MNQPGPYIKHVPAMGQEKPQSPSTSPYIRQTPQIVQAKPEPFAPIIDQGTIEGFGNWTLDEDGLLSINGKGEMPGLNPLACAFVFPILSDSLPESIERVAPWLNKKSSIVEIRIAMGVTRIGCFAFGGCKRLRTITIPDSVTSIESGAFSGCESLLSITIPDSVTRIGGGAFRGCESLLSITIPDSVTRIGGGAFRGCKSLTSIKIPDEVTDVGEDAFADCENLRIVTMPSRLNRLLFKRYYGVPKDVIIFT